MKKKVGIVSCYFQENYGSMLQAYATQKILDDLGYDNETIAIDGLNREIKKAKIRYFTKAALSSDILRYKFGKAWNKVKLRMGKSDYVNQSRLRHKSFQQFKNQWFRLSQPYPSKQALSDACEQRYSAVLVGSDQLWLPANIAADYYTLNFVPDNVNKIAYSTSFGQSTLPKDISKKAAVFLKRINHLSVREETGQVLAEQISGRKIPVVCDPTLLFTAEQWLQLQKKEPFASKGYIFCYFLGNNPEQREFAVRLKEATGCRIIALPHLVEYVQCDKNYADETLYAVDAADFLNLIRHADYICTDSFHCSVFSILYQKTFFAFRRYTKKTKFSTNSRLDTLFHLTGIHNRIFSGNEDIQTCLEQKIDYTHTEEKLAELRQRSIQYLKDSLENNTSTDLN